MQATLAAVSDREVVLEGRHGRKLYFEQLEVKVPPFASMHCLDDMCPLRVLHIMSHASCSACSDSTPLLHSW